MKESVSIAPLERTRLLVLLLAISLAVGAFACDKSATSVPASASSRVENMALHLPAGTEVSFMVSDLKEFRKALQTTRDNLGDALPMADLVEQQARNELGVDLFDAESWKKSGIAADGGLSVSVVSARPVLLTYVEDAQKFETAFSAQLQKRLGLEGMPRSATEGDTKLKALGAGEQTVAWAYDGKLVAAVFPQVDDFKDADAPGDAASATALAARLVKLDAKTSLAKDKGFQAFSKALADTHPAALFVNADRLLNGPGATAFGSGADSDARAQWARKNIEGFGLAMGVKDNALKFRGWAGLSPEALKSAREVLKPAKDSKFQNFATVNTLLGLRMSVNMETLLQVSKDDAQKGAGVDGLLSQGSVIADQMGLDLEKDLLTQMTGNLGVYFYGVDPAALSQPGGLPIAVMSSPIKTLAILVPIQFKDKAGLNQLIAKVIEGTHGAAVRVSVADGVDVLKMQNVTDSPGQFFVKDNLLVYATGTFSDDSVVRYINGKREEETLGSAASMDLGKAFATQTDYNGLYINFLRAQEQLGATLAQTVPGAGAILNKIEEAAIAVMADDKGAFLDVTIDMRPAAPANKAKPAAN